MGEKKAGGKQKPKLHTCSATQNVLSFILFQLEKKSLDMHTFIKCSGKL